MSQNKYTKKKNSKYTKITELRWLNNGPEMILHQDFADSGWCIKNRIGVRGLSLNSFKVLHW